MYHLRKIKVLLATCLLACTSLWAQDVKITISSATASSYHNDAHQAANAIDGNFETIWHSNWNVIPSFPVTFVITLEKESHVDYVRYTPRLSGTNGNWKEVEVSYSTSTSGSSFTSPVTYDLKGASSTFDFPIGAICGQIKFTIHPGETDNGKNLASAAEIAAYAYDTAKPAAFAEYFNGDVYSELKPGVTSSDGIADADVKALVEAMLADAEDYKKFRVGEYEPYMTTATVRNNLKTNSLYNNYENPTGIYLKRDESCIIAVSGIGDYPVGLKIKDWYKSGDLSTYKLRNGLNYITATTEGNVFVDYYTDDFEIAPKVQMHFINAPVLGYWDQATMTNADWESMLAGPLTVDDEVIIITRSEHAQTAYPVKQWKTYCPTDVNSTMTYYQQVQWAERDILGLEMYDRQVKNRQLFYADKSGSMYAGGDASVCGYADLRVLVTPDAKVFDFWGVGHEWGHNNQMAGFYWTGCGETTNNIPASWAQFKFTGNRDANGNPTNLRLEDEVTGINDYKGMRGGRMQTYFEEGLRKGVQWQLQDGPDWHAETPSAVTVTGRDENGNDLGQVNTTWRHYDHFVKLAPFWQLNLWGTEANKNPYIITKVIEAIRVTDNYTSTYNTNGKQQINWMKLACQGAEMDLLPFFEKAGMLRPIHAYVDDYAKGWNIITEEMINELKASVADEVAAGRYQAYPDEEINYINGHNYHIYRDNLKLNVTSMEGERDGDKVTIQHSVAQNAVAFETYNAQDELIRITMYGLGSDDTHSYTQVLFPSSFDESENAAYIMAVGYDGERQRVYQTYANEDEAKYGELGRILTGVEAMQAFCDDTKVGYYKSSALTDLNTAYNTAKAVYDKKESAKYAAVYDMLNTEMMKVKNDATARVGIVEGNTYRLENKLYPTYSMSINSSKEMIGEGTDADSEAQQWYFESSATAGRYYIKNKSTSTYPGDVTTSTLLSATATSTSDAYAYELRDMKNGLWALVGSTGLHCDASKNIVGWRADAEATQWYITVVETNTNAEALNNLQVLVDKAEALIAEIEADGAYSTISTATAQSKVDAAKDVVASGTYDESVYNELNDQYTALLNAKKSVDDAALDAKKLDLSTLIGETNTLINSCGTITVVEAADLVLSTTEGEGVNYLTAGPNSTPSEGALSNLIDNDSGTSFTSNWSTQSGNPYLQVTLPNGKELRKFTFTFTARQGGGAPTPSIIVVSGSNDGQDFTPIATFTKEEHVFPAAASGEQWSSPEITAETAYKYLRFTVTKSERSNSGADAPNGYYHFGISHFGVSSLDEMVVTILPESGNVTKELWFSAYEAVQEAQSVVDYANTEAQVNEAIEKLQEQYQTLDEAKNAAIDFTISSNIAGGGVRYQDVDYTTTLSAPSTLTTGELTAKSVDGYVAKSITINGTEISIIYNKVYTVTITGGEGQGSVTFGGTEYFDGDVFDVEGDFTDDALTVTSVEGYVYDLGVDHITGEIIVIYTVDKSDWSSLVGEVETLINSCYTDGVLNYVNSDFINEDKMTEVRNAIVDAQTQCDNATTLGEYNAAKEALNQAKSTLEMAKASAEAEVIARNEKREALRVLIGQTTDLINLCEENPGDATTALINEVSVAVTLAQSVVDNQGSTEGELNSTIDDLQAKYAVLDAAQQSTAKAELRELIAQAEALIAECGTYGFGEHMVETPVALQTSDDAAAYYLSTNADQNEVDENKQDGGGIGALIDGTVDTYMHTQWSGTAVNDDHYIQVNLGNGKGLAEFTFTYATRKGSGANYTSPAPTIIEVYGSSDDGLTFDAQIARFTSSDETNPLISYTKLGEYWTSGKVELDQSYDYLRFYVRESNGPGSKQYGGHYFFAMSEFALSAVSYETSYYVESLTSYGNVTEEQFLNVARAYDAADDLVENSYDKVELVNAKNNLQAYYDVLMAAHNDYSYLPVTLTTDVENPVLYVMNSKRGTDKVLQYNAGDNDFTIVDATKVNEMVEANASQLFYFTMGTEKGQVYVHPFTAEGRVLAASDKTNGADKVFVAEMDNEHAMQWTFVNATIDDVEWYSLKGVDDAPYFSHYGGGTNKMGFHGSEDDGSRFTFTEKKSHKVTIGQYLHTSLYLNYATTIPEGVKAYIAKNPSEEGTIDLVKLQDGVLPANTGVILYSETPGTYYFLATNASATDDVSENLLKGSASEQYVGDETGAKKYYIFGQKAGVVGLYWARMDYDADGNKVEGEDNGTHFKASANKVYLELDATSGVALSGFRFRVGGDETGIEGITIDADATIYDLYGRRIVEVVTPGIYIINGEKRYINIK